MLIRVEEGGDRSAVHALNSAAFDTRAEADLVDELRERVHPLVSLVAEVDQTVVGHILFTPVSLSAHPDLRIMGLGPMAVAPDRQRSGVGAALVRRGLESCREHGFSAVVVLGHPTYYPRFGFAPASRFDIDCKYDVPDDVFLALELEPGSLAGKTGTVQYDPAFG